MSSKPKFRNSKIKSGIPQELELSDGNKLLWASIYGPMQATVNQFNVMRATVLEQTAKQMALHQGIDLKSYQFHADKGTWQRIERPRFPG